LRLSATDSLSHAPTLPEQTLSRSAQALHVPVSHKQADRVVQFLLKGSIPVRTDVDKRKLGVYLESRFPAVNFEPPTAKGRYQHGTPQDTNSRNVVPKRDLTR